MSCFRTLLLFYFYMKTDFITYLIDEIMEYIRRKPCDLCCFSWIDSAPDLCPERWKEESGGAGGEAVPRVQTETSWSCSVSFSSGSLETGEPLVMAPAHLSADFLLIRSDSRRRLTFLWLPCACQSRGGRHNRYNTVFILWNNGFYPKCLRKLQHSYILSLLRLIWF